MTNTTSQHGLEGDKYHSGSIMGLTQDDGDNAVDVAYSTKPDKWCVTTLNAMSTSNELIKINIHLFWYCDINIIYLLLSVSSSFPSTSSFILQ